MKSTEARQPRETQADAGGAPALRVLELPTRLQVPLAVRPPAGVIAHKPAGSLVNKGERLCELGPEIAPAVLAPTSGRVIGSSRVELLNGHVVPAVDIEPDFEDRAAPGESHDAVRAHEHEQELDAV